MKQEGPHIEDKLLDFTYGELAAAEAQDVESHLANCPACREALTGMEGVRRVMSRLPVESAPEQGLESLLSFAEQAARRAKAGPPLKTPWWMRWLIPAAGLSAAVVIVAVVSKGEVKSAGGIEVSRLQRTPEAAPRHQMGEAESPPLPTFNTAPTSGETKAQAEPTRALGKPEALGTAPKGNKEPGAFAKRDAPEKGVQRRLAMDERSAEPAAQGLVGASQSAGQSPPPRERLAKDESGADDHKAPAPPKAPTEHAPVATADRSAGGAGAWKSGSPAASASPPSTAPLVVADVSVQSKSEEAVEVARALKFDTQRAKLEAFTRQARDAQQRGDYAGASASYKQAVAVATGELRVDLLEEWCGVALKLDPLTETDPPPCAQLQPLRPGSTSLQVLNNRRAQRAAPMQQIESGKTTARPDQATTAADKAETR